MRQTIRQLVADTLGVPLAEVPEDAAIGQFAKWDSLGHLELMLAVEMEFGVRIPTETMLELSSIERIESFLGSQGIPG